MRTLTLIVSALLLLGGLYASILYRPPLRQVASPEFAAYHSEGFALSFEYPRTYILSERDAGNGERKAHTITLIEDTQGNRDILSGKVVGGEGPPAITVQLFQNDLDRYTTEGWIRGTSYSNFKLSPEGRLSTTTLSGQEALSYRWSGLYEGTTVAQAREKWVYAFSVTYLQMGDQIIQDFVRIRDSAVIGAGR